MENNAPKFVKEASVVTIIIVVNVLVVGVILNTVTAGC